MGLPRSNPLKSNPVEFKPASVAPAVPVAAPWALAPSVDAEARPANASIVDAGPSKNVLLERAALGPARPTWASMALPIDPVLGEKMHPRVAERRARFRRVVKVTLGACVALCLASLVAVAFGGSKEAQASPILDTTTTLRPVTPIEKMDDARRTKSVAPTHSVRRAWAKHR